MAACPFCVLEGRRGRGLATRQRVRLRLVLTATLDGDDDDALGEDGRASPVFIDDGVNAVKVALK